MGWIEGGGYGVVDVCLVCSWDPEWVVKSSIGVGVVEVAIGVCGP